MYCSLVVKSKRISVFFKSAVEGQYVCTGTKVKVPDQNYTYCSKCVVPVSVHLLKLQNQALLPLKLNKS